MAHRNRYCPRTILLPGGVSHGDPAPMAWSAGRPTFPVRCDDVEIVTGLSLATW